VLIATGGFVALNPFSGSVRAGSVPAGSARSVGCGAPVLAVNIRSTRTQLAALSRFSRTQARGTPQPPSPDSLARLDRLLRGRDRYDACRDAAVARMTIADVLVAAGLAAIALCVWRPQDRVVPAGAGVA
jgi:hypothetical protein